MTRVFGFEIMPAPYVIAHWQMGLLLSSLGAPLSDNADERAGIYLTNALTGWEPPTGAKTQIPLYPEFAQEREAAAHVKRDVPILVILGNPPYNGFAGTAMEEERDLVKAYRSTRKVRAPEGQGLNDLYVRFFRMAERRIVDATGKGVVCFISNYSWLDGLSFTGMRERYLEVFDHIWIDCLNGDKYKTGKLTPEGDPDPSIFSTERNPEGIQVGTAIALMARTIPHVPASGIGFRHLWGKHKRQTLLETADQSGKSLYSEETPALDLGLPFTHLVATSGYSAWPKLPDLFPTSFPGVKTSRDEFLIDIDREQLLARLRVYFDPKVGNDEIKARFPESMRGTARFDPVAVRTQLVVCGLLENNIRRYCYRPFDLRWLYWEPETKLLDEKRPDYIPHILARNVWIEARERQPKDIFDRGYVLTVIGDNLGNGLSSYFPLYLRENVTDRAASETLRPNVTARASSYLAAIGTAEQSLFYHIVALLHVPAFRRENAGALRQDWPRIALPRMHERLEESAALGRQLAALLDPETQVSGVTSGGIRSELRVIGNIARSGGGALKPREFEITAGSGQGKRIARAYAPEEEAAIIAGARALGLNDGEVFDALGGETGDVYLNDAAYWSNIPAKVWDYTIGGYQVIKKWLSYRELDLLGRALTADEIRYVTEMARRIAAILLLQTNLDANYRAVITDTYPWPRD
jgi:hypothetical protein